MNTTGQYQQSVHMKLAKNLVRFAGVFCSILLMSASAYAGKITYSQHYKGAQIAVTSGALVLQDEFYQTMQNSGWQNDFVNHHVTNRVILRHTGQDKKSYGGTPWTITVEYTLQNWNENSSPAPINGSLTISYDDATGLSYGGHNDIRVYAYEGAHKSKMTITGVNSSLLGNVVPEDVFIELEMEVERYYFLDQTIVPNISASLDPTNNTIDFVWGYIKGAEAYHLEWYWTEDATTPMLPSDIKNVDYARVVVGNTHYEHSNAFDQGRLYFRVRPVGRHLDAADHLRLGKWSNSSGDFINVTNLYQYANWAYQASFAEQGKIKEVVQFADGTTRTRQTATRLNTQGAAIFAETLYDYEGRPTVGVASAPEVNRSNSLQFHANLSLNTGAVLNGINPDADLFSKKQFDVDATSCLLTSPAMGAANGAGNYYSASNLVQTGMDAYLPESGEVADEQYPYTRAVYGLDGRIKASGGVGPTHKLGAGHENKFFYTSPLPAKIDRLFGNEVGDAAHYFLNATQDANGQLSLSYLDKAGQTIATSLVGQKPAGLDAVYAGTGLGTIDDTFDPFNHFEPQSNSYEINTDFFVELAATDYDFTYTITPAEFASLCNAPGGDCVYDLRIEIFDDCLQPVYDQQSVLHNTYLVDASFVSGQLPLSFTVVFPSVGTYKIEKTLTINQDQFQIDKDAFIDFITNDVNSCIPSLDDLIASFQDNVNLDLCDGCTTGCGFPAIPDFDCSGYLQTMVVDMNPGGQYFNNQPSNNNAPVSDAWLTTYVEVYADPYSIGGDFWANAGYVSPVDGVTPLGSWTDLWQFPNHDWANQYFAVPIIVNGRTYEKLLHFHPESCHVFFCVKNEPSYSFDVTLANTTWADAQTAGYVGGAPPLAPMTSFLIFIDPFFDANGIGMFNGADYTVDMTPEVPVMWANAQAVVDLSSNGTCTTGTCMDEKWQMFALMYAAKKWEYLEEVKSVGGCAYICDASMPLDNVADICGLNTAEVIDFTIRFPDLYSLLFANFDPSDLTGTQVDLNDMGDDIAEGLCLGAQATGNIDLSNYWQYFTNVYPCGVNEDMRVLVIDPNTGIWYPITAFGTPYGSYASEDAWEVAVVDAINFFPNPDFTAVLNTTNGIGNYSFDVTAVLSGAQYNGWSFGVDCIGGGSIVYAIAGPAPGLDGGCGPIVDGADCFCYLVWNAVDYYEDLLGTTGQTVYEAVAADLDIDYETVEYWLTSCNDIGLPFLAGTVPTLPHNTGFYVDVPANMSPCDIDDPCGENALLSAAYFAGIYYDALVDNMVQDWIDMYVDNCMNPQTTGTPVEEHLDVSYMDMEYQFTLFYYDRVGNLVRTVPPEGVEKLDAAGILEVQAYRANPTVQANTFTTPEHSLVTYYYYNSLNQLVKSYVPDHVPMANLTAQVAGTGMMTSPQDIAFTGCNKGYTLSSSGEIYITHDGGSSWLPHLPLFPTGHMNKLVFFGCSTAYAVGDGNELHYTTDAWLNSTTILNTAGNINDIAFVNGGRAIFITDAGGIFEVLGSSAPSSLTTTSPAVNLNKIDITGIYGFIGADGGNIFKIDDVNSPSPNILPLPSIGTDDVLSIDFVSSTLGYAITVSGIYSIDAAGISTPLTHNVTSPTFSDLVFTDATHGYVSGATELLIHTSDGGTNWVQETLSGTGTNLLAITSSGPNQFVAVTNTGNAVLGTNQPVSQKLWYDPLGRVGASQNARQASYSPKGYAYVQYDALGRPVQAGELYSSTTPESVPLGNVDLANIWSIDRGEVSFTEYDETTATGAALTAFGANGQEQLRSRVAASKYVEDYNGASPTVYDAASFYSYDIHGNVKTLVQENKALEDIGHHVKKTAYDYDLISGNVNEVQYQEGELDQFIHRYDYDADNRITNVFTSRDGHVWDQDAKYFYYLHGPLARVETGEEKVQGTDFAYTIHGWLKGVNANRLNAAQEMGRDGLGDLSYANQYGNAGSYDAVHDNIGRDAFGFSLSYFSEDYNSISSFGNTHWNNLDYTLNGGNGSTVDNAGDQLYNGNIRHMATALVDENEQAIKLIANIYRYDQLQRLKMSQSKMFSGIFNNGVYAQGDPYEVNLTYDGNGNILTLNRQGDATVGNMDAMSYNYDEYTDVNGAQRKRSNKLYLVNDAISTSTFAKDIEDQGAFSNANNGNYVYDQLGQLVSDAAEEILTIEWNAAGKIKEILRTAASDKSNLAFHYDAAGQRILKIAKPRSGGSELPEGQWTYTYYSRDASGNVMATYTRKKEDTNSNGEYEDIFSLNELPLYGSKRLGLKNSNHTLYERRYRIIGVSTSLHDIDLATLTVQPTPEEKDVDFYTRVKGTNTYELANHLGNVLSTVSDRRIPIDTYGYTATPGDYTYISTTGKYAYTQGTGTHTRGLGGDGVVDHYTADVLSYSDYYPFGMQMPGRNGGEDYRYAFNGMEQDPEVSGDGNSYTTEFRQYDPRLGRWKSLDPIMAKFPHQSPYVAFDNDPIYFSDPNGLAAIGGDDPPKGSQVVSQTSSTTTSSSDIGNTNVFSVTTTTSTTEFDAQKGEFTFTTNSTTDNYFSSPDMGVWSSSSSTTNVEQKSYKAITGVDYSWHSPEGAGFWAGVGDGAMSFGNWMVDNVSYQGKGKHERLANIYQLKPDSKPYFDQFSDAVTGPIKMAEHVYYMNKYGNAYHWGEFTGSTVVPMLALRYVPKLGAANLTFRWLYDSPYKTVLKTPFTKGNRYLSGFQVNSFRFQFHKHRIHGSDSYLPHMNFGINGKYHLFLGKEGISRFGLLNKKLGG